MQDPSLAIVIPSFERGRTLLDSLRLLLGMQTRANEIIVVDQTQRHPPEVEHELAELAGAGRIRWSRLPLPSIPHAMNVGLLECHSEIVLFLDDDIVPDAGLVEAHRAAHAEAILVAGMVLQPGQQAERLAPGEAFRFNSPSPARIAEFMGGNFSIRRAVALSLGGFDENFVGAAYRYEAEFAHRFVRAHGPIRYEPNAMIHHLAIATGGTRTHGHHLRTMRPDHSAGAYYYLLRTRTPGWLAKICWRPVRSVRTRHHLRRPWWIPVTLLAEMRGLLLALRLNRRGPRLLTI